MLGLISSGQVKLYLIIKCNLLRLQVGIIEKRKNTYLFRKKVMKLKYI